MARVKAEYRKPKIRKHRKELALKNYYADRAKRLEQMRIWHKTNKDIRNPRKAQYMRDNRERWNQNARNRRQIDLNFRLRRAMRARISRAIKRNQRAGSAVRDLGCSIEQLKAYIATKFKPGMSWDNWGTVWQLDHIKPLAWFNLANRKQFLKACHYTNLQPLTVAAHHIKTATERLTSH